MDEVEAVKAAIEDQLTAEDGWMVGTPALSSMCHDFALAAIAALDAARGDPVARVVEWLRKENGLCDCHARCETECGCGAWDDWKTKPLLEIADAIERGEPFNG